MVKRKSLSKKLRFDVFKRDGFSCQYCGANPPNIVLEVDHIIAVANGGGDEMDNLITSCFDCNRGKAAESLTCVPQSLSDKAKDVEEREQQILGYQAVMQERRERLENEAWEILSIIVSERRGRISVKKDWFNSTKRFLESLGYDAVLEAIEIAASKYPRSSRSAFPYFCGICWNKIRRTKNGEN